MADLKPHVVFLAAWYPDQRDPMFGLFVHNHAVLLTRACRVSVLTVTYYDDEENGIFVSSVDQVFVVRVNIRTKCKPIRWIHFFLASMKAYRHICRQNGKPVVHHVHILTRMGVLAWWLQLRRHIPFVVTEHWSRYFEFPGTYRNPIRKWITRCVCRRAHCMSAVSLGLEKAMQSHAIGNGKPWMRVNNVVDETIFRPGTGGLPSHPVRCIQVSCFEDRSKNLSGLISAVEMLVNEGFSIECVMAGTGQDFNMIQELVKAKKLQDHVVLPGLLSPEQIAGWMQKSHFYVQPSHYENVPVVISEALMCGLPVLATRVGSVDEMIDETNGLLIESGNSEKLAAAIKQMTEQYTSYNKNTIRANAMAKYSSGEVLKQLLRLYPGLSHE